MFISSFEKTASWEKGTHVRRGMIDDALDRYNAKVMEKRTMGKAIAASAPEAKKAVKMIHIDESLFKKLITR